MQDEGKNCLYLEEITEVAASAPEPPAFTALVPGLISGRTYSGTYVVNEDCTYSTIIVDSFGQEHIGDYVIVDRDEVRAIRADDTNVVTLNLKRIRRRR